MPEFKIMPKIEHKNVFPPVFKKIENNMGINGENVRSFAAFILYGAVGTIYNDYIIKGENKTNSSEAFGIISELFQRPH